MSDNTFNPGSADAMFATILAKMDAHAEQMKAQAEETASFRKTLVERLDTCGQKIESLDRRIEVIEGDKKKLIGIAVGTGLGGGGLWHGITNFFSSNH